MTLKYRTRLSLSITANLRIVATKVQNMSEQSYGLTYGTRLMGVHTQRNPPIPLLKGGENSPPSIKNHLHFSYFLDNKTVGFMLLFFSVKVLISTTFFGCKTQYK